MAAKPVTVKAKGFLAAFRGWQSRDRVSHSLRSWKQLNEVIGLLTEAELMNALAVEGANKRRENMVKRLKQRLSKLRRDELMSRKL